MNDLTTKQNIQDFKIDWNYYRSAFLITQSGLSKKSVKAYATAINKFVSFLQEKEINRPLPDDIHVYQGSLRDQGFSVFTINLYMIALKKFFAYLQAPYKDQKMVVYKDIYKMANPKIKRPARGRHYKEIPTGEAIDRLRGSFGPSQKDQRDLLMVDLALYCGCRVNEIANIKASDLIKDGDNYRLYLLRKNHTAKTSSVFIASEIVSRIKGYIKKYRVQSYLFTDLSHVQLGKKGHLCSSTVSTIISRHLKRAEVKKDTITAHSMRHYAGTSYYQLTKDLYATQQFMGHSDSKTTEIYMHVDRNYEVNAVALQPA